MSGDRRNFLQGAAAAGAFLIGCGDDESLDPDDGGTGGMGGSGAGGAGAGGSGGSCEDPFAGGEYLENASFVDEATFDLNTPFNVGWDGRLYTDLELVDQDNLIVPNEYFYIRTRYPDLLDAPAQWTIGVSGLATPTTLNLSDLMPLAQDMGALVLECSGNSVGGSFGLLSAAQWGGIPMADVLAMLDISPQATRVLLSGFDGHSVPSAGGHSTPGASWVFTFEQLDKAGAFLATEMNGEPLPPDHGEPVRLFVPGWYGCTNIKWVDEIVLVDESQPATSQMMEFASRTHQEGVPMLAKDYRPASIDQAAMPIRIEKWRVSGEIVYRVAGILWGGYELTDKLQIQYGAGGKWLPVDTCSAQETNRTWTVWYHQWRPSAVGQYALRCRIDDPNIETKRLDIGYYERVVSIDEV